MRISDWSSDVCSSDLTTESLRQQGSGRLSGLADGFRTLGPREAQADRQLRGGRGRRLSERRSDPKPVSSSLAHPRSEEHTSELQSLMRISYAVFCLKKKKYST